MGVKKLGEEVGGGGGEEGRGETSCVVSMKKGVKMPS
jgi:hypothetical protein